METDINAVVQFVKDIQAASAGGALVAASVALFGLIKILRLPLLQALLGKISPKLQWGAFPKWVCVLVVFVISAVGSFLVALAAGTAAVPALIGAVVAAIPLALGAMGIDGAVSAVSKPAEPAVNP